MTPLLKSLVPAIVFALGSPALVLHASPQGTGTSSLSGRVTLLLPPKVAIDPGGTVVWIPGLTALAAGPTTGAVTSKDKRFEPRILAVPAGTSVRFPNLDTIYHNAFSLSPGNTFDMGLYRKGASREVVLKNPGIVRVYCNIHPDMAASVVVVTGNAFAVVGKDGAYRIDGIPPGRHEVHLWSDMAGEQVIPLVFEAGKNAEWSPAVDATKYQRVAHANKYGKAYPKAKNDADRY